MEFVENIVYRPRMPKSFGNLIMRISKSVLRIEEKLLQKTWVDLENRWNI